MQQIFSIENLTKCVFGQSLAAAIAIGTLAQTTILKTDPETSYFAMYIGMYTLVFTISTSILIYQKIFDKKLKIHISNKFISQCILSCVLDYLAGHFLNLSFTQTSAYLIIFITQLIYPFSAIIDYYIFKKNIVNFNKIVSFITMSFICFLINFRCETDKFHCNLENVWQVLISNLLFMIDIFLQQLILKTCEPLVYTCWFSGLGFVVGPLLSTILNSNNSFKMVNMARVSFAVYWVSFAVYYLFSSKYVSVYDVSSYNGSTIMSSAYYGIYVLCGVGVSENVVYLGLFVVCILANMVIIARK